MIWSEGAGKKTSPFVQDTIDVPPVGVRDNLPWWERPWISPSLHKALFDLGAPVYWIADPTRYRAAVQSGDLDGSRSQTTALCPRAKRDMEAVAPRLIGPINPDRPDTVIRNAVTDCLGQRVGLFLVGDVRHDQLAQHLLRFVFLPASNPEKPLFFRFWDPLVALAFLRINEQRPERVGRFLGVPEGPTLTLLAEAGSSEIKIIRPSDDIPRLIDQPELDAKELAAFDNLDMDRFVRTTAAWLIKTFGGASVPTIQVEAAIRSQIVPLRGIGIRSEYAMNFALAGLYLLGLHSANLPADGHAILTNISETEDARARQFLTWAQAHPHRRHLHPKGQPGHA